MGKRDGGGVALAVQGDVSDAASCAEIVAAARSHHGSVGVLVNNAMWTHFAPIKDLAVKRWQLCFAVNVQGPFRLSQLVLPDMIARRSGAIVNISSNGSIGPRRGPYQPAAATCWDTTGVASRTMYGVSVSCVAPSVGVATGGNIHYKLFKAPDDPRAEPLSHMTRAALLLAMQPLVEVTGRVTYGRAILKEFGWINDAKGFGVTEPGSGFSQI